MNYLLSHLFRLLIILNITSFSVLDIPNTQTKPIIAIIDNRTFGINEHEIDLIKYVNEKLKTVTIPTGKITWVKYLSKSNPSVFANKINEIHNTSSSNTKIINTLYIGKDNFKNSQHKGNIKTLNIMVIDSYC